MACGSFGNTPKLSWTDFGSARSVLRGRQFTRKYGRWASERVEMSADRVDRTWAVKTRQTGSQFARDLEKYGRWASERVEMSADRVDWTRAVPARLTNGDPTNRKSVRERLRKIWQICFREDRNVGGPSRLDTGRHYTGPDKPEVSSRETEKYGRSASERTEMSADRVNRRRAVTARLAKRDPTKGKWVRERLRKIWQVGFREGRNVGGPSRSDTGRRDRSSKTRLDKPEVSSRET